MPESSAASSSSTNSPQPSTLLSCENEEQMLSLLEGGADPRIGRDEHTTPLRKAVEMNWRKAIEKMFSIFNPADFINQNCSDGCQNHPIISECKNEEVALLLLRNGADPIAAGCRAVTPLMRAVTNGWDQVIKEMFQKSDPLKFINFVNQVGQTALVRCEKEETALLLLKNGADSKIGKRHGKTFEEIANEKGWEKAKLKISEKPSELSSKRLSRREPTPLTEIVMDAPSVSEDDVSITLPGQMPSPTNSPRSIYGKQQRKVKFALGTKEI